MQPFDTARGERTSELESEHTNGRERIFHLVRWRTCALERNLEALCAECSDRKLHNQTAQDVLFQTRPPHIKL